MAKEEEYDGFYFLPGEDEDEMNLAYFKFKDGTNMGSAIENTQIGDKFHIAFFRKDVNGNPEFQEEFEAIFADPSVYVKNLVGCNLYGCILRKTENSTDWWRRYLTQAQNSCTIN